MRWLYLVAIAFLALAGAVVWWAAGTDALPSTPAAAPPGPGSVPPSAGARPELSQADAASRATHDSGPREAQLATPPVGEAAPAAEVAAAGIAVTGRVVDELGSPIADAVVYGIAAESWGGVPLDSRFHDTSPGSDRRDARTDDVGRFVLADLEPGTARLAVRAPGFAPYDDDTVPLPAGLAPGSELDVGELTLSPGIVLAGNVVDERNFGVAGAELIRIDEAAGFLFRVSSERGALLATTGDDGAFRIDTLAPGPWKIMVASDRHPDEVFEGVTERGVVSGLAFELDPGASIGGRVLSAGGRALEGLVVRASAPGRQQVTSLSGPLPWREAECDAEGRFLIEGVTPGEVHHLRVRAGGEQLVWSLRWLSARVEALAGATGVVLELEPSATVVFRVVDAATGEPLGGFGAELFRGSEKEEYGRNDERMSHDPGDGTTTLAGVRVGGGDGTVALAVSKVDYRAERLAPRPLVANGAVDFGTVALTPLPTFAVRVVDDANDAPVAGAEVKLWIAGDSLDERFEARREQRRFDSGGFHTAETDEHGVARLPRFEGRDGELTAERGGYATTAPLSFRLGPGDGLGDEPALVLRLGRGGTVAVHVLDPAGRPVTDALVTEVHTGRVGDDEDERPTNSKGVALFGPLAPGPHRFVVAPVRTHAVFDLGEGKEQPPPGTAAVIEVLEGFQRITLTRPPRGSLVGRVTEGGNGLAGADLRLDRGADDLVIPGLTDQPVAQAGGDGRFRIGPLDAGTYTLVIAHPSRAMDTRVEAVVSEGERELDVDLPLTIVEGRVTDAGGRPVEGARVRVRSLEAPGGSSSTISFTIGEEGGGEPIVFRLGGQRDTSASTGLDGRYQLRGLLADTPLAVSVEHAEFLSVESEPFELDAGEIADEVDFALEPAGRLEVTVRVGGSPVPDVPVRARFSAPKEELDPGVADVTALTDGEGRALLGGLAPGTWAILVEPPGWAEEDYPATKRATVHAESIGRLDFELR